MYVDISIHICCIAASFRYYFAGEILKYRTNRYVLLKIPVVVPLFCRDRLAIPNEFSMHTLFLLSYSVHCMT